MKRLVAILLLLAICMVTLALRNSTRPTPAATPNPAVGLITHVSTETISIRTRDGQELEFVNQIQNFPLSHLREHQTAQDPVSIRWQAQGNKMTALAADDAPRFP